jgi:2-C-methyl-D-erythritol 4-phosphate cytidylyltransferase
MKVWGIVPAAGIGERMGGTAPKQFLEIGGVPMLARVIDALLRSGIIGGVTVPVRDAEREKAEKTVAKFVDADVPVLFVTGGQTRQESVYRGLASVEGKNPDFILIHDAARPFISPDIVRRAVDVARDAGASVVGIPATDAMALSRDGIITEYLPRDALVCIQTPQVFRYDLVVSAHEAAVRDGITGAADDAELVLRLGGKIVVVRGSPDNIKITYPADISRMGTTG